MQINVDLIYPIGSLYITTDTTFNPNIKFGGTWSRLEGDVYLKNIPTNSGQPIGNYGGTSSSHKIPVTSMPSHTHSVKFDQSTNGGTAWLKSGGNSGGPYYSSEYVGSTGGGQPYYPYYYGVICWHRTV